MAKLKIEFTHANDPVRETAYCDTLEFDEMRPIPGVGDSVTVLESEKTFLFQVERRHFFYNHAMTHVQLFCKEVDDE